MPDRPRAAIVYDCLFPVDTGGGERVYRRIAELLAERGYEVDYLTRERGPGQQEAAGGAFRVVPVWRGEINDAQGVRRPLAALRFGWAVLRALRRQRRAYALVLASATPVFTAMAASLALAGTRVPLVVDWLEVWSWRKWRAYSGALVGTVAALLQRIALRLGTVLTANSSFTAERIRRRRPGAEPLLLGLVDLADDEQAALCPAQQPPRLLFAGRHIADKRVEAIPAALARARAAVPDLSADIAGSGPQTPVVRAQAALLELGDALRLPGRVEEPELVRLMSGAAVLLNPSAREGFGLVVAEAARYGTPSVVVAGEDNAAVELVVDGVNGFVAPSASASDLADAVCRVLAGGPALRASTRAWFERERSRRSLSVSVDRLLERLAARPGA